MEPRERLNGEPRPEDARAPGDFGPPVEAPVESSTQPPLETPSRTPPEDTDAEELESQEPPVDAGPVQVGWQGIGSVLGRSLDTYGSAFPTFLALGVPVAIFTAVTVIAAGNVLAVLLASILTALVGLVTSAAMIYTTDDLGRGVRPTLASVLDRASDRVIPLFLSTLVVLAAILGISILVGIVIVVLGLAAGTGPSDVLALTLLAIAAIGVPAAYIGLRWALSSPSIVLAELGPMAGLNRSFSLTRGHLWRLVGLYFVLTLVVLPAAAGANLVSMYAPQRAVAAAGLAITTLLTAPILAIVIATVYRDLVGRPEGEGVPRGQGRKTAIAATLGGGVLVFAVGIWAVTSAGGQIFLPERGQVVAGTSQNVLDPCHPNGIKTEFDSGEEIWIAAIFTQKVPAGDEAVVEFFGDGLSLGSAVLTAVPPGTECYYEQGPVRNAEPGTYRIVVTYLSTVIADGSFTVR